MNISDILNSFSIDNKQKIIRFIELIYNQVEINNEKSLHSINVVVTRELMMGNEFTFEELKQITLRLDDVFGHNFIRSDISNDYNLTCDFFNNKGKDFKVTIFDLHKLNNIYKEVILFKKNIKNNDINKDEEQEKSSYWFYKDKKGQYFFDGNPIDINNDSNYEIIFDVTYSIKPNGGILLYREIINLCKERGKKEDVSSIQRALTGDSANLFRYIKGIKQKPAFNKPIFDAIRNGKEIRFNNKK